MSEVLTDSTGTNHYLEFFEAGDYPPEDGAEPLEDGWYFWFCLPGCLPDSEPYGPFDTYEAAEAAAREEID